MNRSSTREEHVKAEWKEGRGSLSSIKTDKSNRKEIGKIKFAKNLGNRQLLNFASGQRQREMILWKDQQ